MFALTVVDLEYDTSVSIWEFEMMIVLIWQFCLHFTSIHDKIHKTQMKLCLLMNSDTLIWLWILVNPFGLIEVSTSRKCCFLLYFSSLHDYWSPSTWNSLVHTSWGKMERCEKRAFPLLKIRKRTICWNIKTKCVIDFLLLVRSSRMKDYTFITWWSHRRQTLKLISIKIKRIWNFFVYK